MKNLEFRFWNYDKNEMQYAEGIFNVPPDKAEMDKISEVMQYTGLDDVDGKKIFEGDMIRSYRFNYRKELIKADDFQVRFGKCLMEFDREFDSPYGSETIHGFYVADESTYVDFIHGRIKVMGNIYE